MVLDKLKKLGDLKKMRDQAMKAQKELAKETVEVDHGDVHIVMTGDQKVKKITINGEERKQIGEAVNKAIKKSQKVAAKKLRGFTGF
jgi:hypothetical protein